MAWEKAPERAGPREVETSKPAYPLNFDFRNMDSTEGVSAQKWVSMKGNILTLGTKSFPLDTNTKSVSVSRYTDGGSEQFFLEIRVYNKSGPDDQLWLNEDGQLLKREPKGGVLTAEDITDIMLNR